MSVATRGMNITEVNNAGRLQYKIVSTVGNHWYG